MAMMKIKKKKKTTKKKTMEKREGNENVLQLLASKICQEIYIFHVHLDQRRSMCWILEKTRVLQDNFHIQLPLFLKMCL